MIKRYMLKEYLTYVIPTMLTFTLTCIYSIIDGIFVGNFVGDAGLAGVNVAFPLVTLIMAIGTGIGIGGAVIASIELGRGSTEKNQRAYGNTFLMMLISRRSRHGSAAGVAPSALRAARRPRGDAREATAYIWSSPGARPSRSSQRAACRSSETAAESATPCSRRSWAAS